MSRSTSLLRANPLLTSNVMLMVSSDYSLYLASYNANSELSDKQFKKNMITPDSFLSQRIASFYKGLPVDIAFDVKNDIKSDTIQNQLVNQYDDIYYSGARQVEDTSYKEEFQYNTTLQIDPNNLPKGFIIFRVDNPGLSVDINSIFNNLKVVNHFDLTQKTSIGKLWKKNYIDDDQIPRSPIELNFKQFEFSQWKGYDYYTGGSVSKSFFVDEFFQNQTTDFDLERFLTQGFKNNAVICANYSNISYLFDDTVSGVYYKNVNYSIDQHPNILQLIKSGYITSDQYVLNSLNQVTFNQHIPYRKKWTINRYTGFYIDNIKPITKITPYVPVTFKNDNNIQIVDNKFVILQDILLPYDPITNPYIPISPIFGVWDNNLPVYFKTGTDNYLVEKQPSGDYLIVSDVKINGNMTDLLSTAQKPIKIEYEQINNDYYSVIKYVDDSYFYHNDFITYKDGIIVIKINDQTFKLNFDHTNKKTYIFTDDIILCDSNILSITLGETGTIKTSNQVVTKDNTIKYYEISLLQLTDIADFDFDRTITDQAKIEYDTIDGIQTFRPYIYGLDVNDKDLPKDLYLDSKYNIWKGSTQLADKSSEFILPLASEYASSGDLYMLDQNNELTEIWDINQSINKWCINQSINNNSTGYKINNNLDLNGVHNFTSNMLQPNISIDDLNLDWFYSLGKPINYNLDDANSLLSYGSNLITNIKNYSLNIDLDQLYIPSLNPNQIDYNYVFDIEFYKDIDNSFDYFDYIFNSNIVNNSKYTKIDRISYVQHSDSINGPEVFLRGLSANLLYTNLSNPNETSDYIISSADDLVDYGFASLFSSRYTTDVDLYGKAGIEVILNKIHKNILLNIFIYVPHGKYTSIDYRKRDEIYHEDVIKYIDINDNWVDSSLKVQSLTLNNIVRILSKNLLSDDTFDAGIQYTVLQNQTQYVLDNIVLDGTDITNKTVILTFKQDINFKQNDWIKVYNTSLINFDVNVQISERINNRTIKIKFNDAVVLPSFDFVNNVYYVTDKVSVLPFKFNIILPDEIKIDKSINNVIGDDSCPITPNNNTNIIFDLDVTDLDYIPNVYNKDSISRKVEKKNLNDELNYEQLNNLPSILRFSGDYQPQLKTIELFNNTDIVCYNNVQDLADLQASAITQFMSYDSTTKKISIELTNALDQLNDVRVGDVFFISRSDDFDYLQYRTGYITKVSDATHVVGKMVELNFTFDVAPFVTVDFSVNAKFNIYLYRPIEKNSIIDYNYKDLAIKKQLIVAKTYDSLNPMLTNSTLNNTISKYPMIDEFGSTTIDRNIFQSSWDNQFYYKAIKNKYKTK